VLYGNKGPQIRANGVPNFHKAPLRGAFTWHQNWELFFSHDTQWVKTLGITPRYPLGIIWGGGGTGGAGKKFQWKNGSNSPDFEFKKFQNRQSFMITSRRYPRIYVVGFCFLFF